MDEKASRVVRREDNKITIVERKVYNIRNIISKVGDWCDCTDGGGYKREHNEAYHFRN